MDTFNLGDIVALHSHPYENNLLSIVITGEPQFVPPLMVVVELLKDVTDSYDEKTGDIISKRGYAQCKCLWYSAKAHQFEDAWISSKNLKSIKQAQPAQNSLSEEERRALYGKLVLFKTSRIEGQKQKSSVISESSFLNTSKRKTITNPLLHHLSPLMLIMQIVEAKVDVKDAIFDPKTGGKKRIVPKHLVKCKWYSPLDKFSEKLLPLECLELVPSLQPGLLNNIQASIDNVGFFTYGDTILQPLTIFVLNGYYFLNAFDFVTNTTVDLELHGTIDLIPIPKPYSHEVPEFNFTTGEVLPENYFVDQYTDAVNTSSKKNKYIRIKYNNRVDEVSTRTLKNYSVIQVEEGAKNVVYLRGFCMTRKAIRNFKISRIQNLQVLVIDF